MFKYKKLVVVTQIIYLYLTVFLKLVCLNSQTNIPIFQTISADNPNGIYLVHDSTMETIENGVKYIHS